MNISPLLHYTRTILHFSSETRNISRQELELLVDNSVLLGKTIDAIIGLAHPPDGSADSVGLVGSGHPAGSLINLSQVYLKIVHWLV